MSKLPQKDLSIFAGDPADRIVYPAFASEASGSEPVQAFEWSEGASLPDRLLRTVSSLTSPARLYLHRKALGPKEIGNLGQIREAIAIAKVKPSVVLVVGDLARYSDLQIAATLVDRIIPESIAADLRRAESAEPRIEGADHARTPIGILSANDALAETLKDILLDWAYQPRVLQGWSDPVIPSGSLLIWDVPVLSDRWENRLRDQSRLRPILTLMGFADGSDVDRAREAGAIATLGLPFDIEDMRNIVGKYAVVPAFGAAKHQLPQKSVLPNRELRNAGGSVRKDSGHRLRPGADAHFRSVDSASPSAPSGMGGKQSISSDD